MIEEIEVRRGSIPLTETDPRQLWTEEWSNQLYVKMRANGVVGWGEILPAAGNAREPYVALVERLREVLLGRDESGIDDLWKLMRRATFTGGYGVTTGAISGIDIALWDIAGRKKSLPVRALLGRSGAERLKRYASLSRYKTNDDLRAAIGNLLEGSYRSIKIHQSAADTLDAVKMIREKFGYDFELMADLNCGFFDFDRAKEFMKNAARYELKWVEEPIWPPDDFDSLGKLNRIGKVAAGENFFSYHEFKRLLEDDCLSFYQPDVAKCGGITPLVELFELFREHKVKVALHNRPHNGWVGTCASAHMASAFAPDVDTVIETPPNEIPREYFSFHGVRESKDFLEPVGPGLGISPREPIPESRVSRLLRFH